MTTTDEQNTTVDPITQERIDTHEPHGWYVLMPLEAVHSMKPIAGYMMQCSCGWHGWIAKDPNRKVVQSRTETEY